MSYWLEAKSLVIIGGTSGIGLAAARAFIREGAQVIAVGLDDESVSNARNVLPAEARVMKGNATLQQTAVEAIDMCVSVFGSFDGLYHVAGGSGRKFGDGPLHELTLDGWNQTINLNLTSLMLSNQAAIRKFIELGVKGTILNVGSVLGYSPSPRHFVTHAYAASKAAVEGFTRSIAAYYASYGIRINTLAPGLVETPMSARAASDAGIMAFIKTKQPLDHGRVGLADDLTGAAVYFMSDYSAFTTGQILSVDGGWSISEGQYTS
ncbi:SDR family oxidoreductase [Chryseolinea sp. T2]|uniref:SDR family NAD(P)-dependent oxidoreductase n=1 Tax=Chryseolinea sp. T2 TaxID=3129255 RepID=UPI00307703E2